MPRPLQYKPLLDRLLDTPGVYLMYGSSGELLYVGKSKTLRSRVRAHFTAREERVMCRQVRRVEARETAGELGALLLESELIKQLKPMYNRALRKTRRLTVARKVVTPQGYFRIALEAVSTMDAAMDAAQGKPVMALFRTKTQAVEYLSEVAKTHRLCLALLGLEQTRRHCFSYHLHRCNGACMGEEAPELYNARLEQAFEARRIQAWPFTGAVLIEETNDTTSETFIVDHWCLLYSFTHTLEKFALHVKGSHYFDYDAYKILAGYIFDDAHRQSIRQIPRTELAELVKKLKAA